MNLLMFAGGLVLLILGAEFLVRGAADVAQLVGISPLVVGLTVVAVGTASPEIAVSLSAALEGHGDIAIGNVVGSNILNVLVVLGASSIIAPLAVNKQLVRRDVPLMIFASGLLFVLSLDGRLGRIDGIVMLVLFAGYLWVTIRRTPQLPSLESEVQAATGNKVRRASLDLGMVVGGLAVLLLGAWLLVEGTVAMARSWGVSELVISLTVVAIGTSAPELATSIAAALRGQRELAIGNVVGSNICNILLILGLVGLFSGDVRVAPGVLHLDLPVMVAVALVCLPIFFTGYVISRVEGLLFLGYYIGYTVYLLLHTTQHDSLPIYTRVVAVLVGLTLLTLAIGSGRAWLARRKPAEPAT